MNRQVCLLVRKKNKKSYVKRKHWKNILLLEELAVEDQFDMSALFYRHQFYPATDRFCEMLYD